MTALLPERDVAHILGCPIDRLGMDATIERCRALIDAGTFAQQVSVNAAKLVALRDDRRLREIVTSCEIVNGDGQSVVWASRVLGDPLPERVAGIDLMMRLLALAEEQGYGVFFLGATQSVLEDAIARIRERYPLLRVVGFRNGYFEADEEADVRDQIRRTAPQILFVAMGSPRKEYWLAANGDGLGVALAMGVGGSLDVVAGRVRRAPQWVRHAGLEWLFRVAQEPGRLWRRYLTTNVRFVALLVRELVVRRSRRRHYVRASG